MHLEAPEWLTLLTWVSVFFATAALAAMLFFGGHTVRLAVRVTWFRHRAAAHPMLRPILLTVASAITGAWMLQLSWSENLAMRLSLMAVGAGVAWVFLDWSAKQTANWIETRSAVNADWHARAHEATSELRALFETEAIHRESCRLLRERLGSTHVYLYTKGTGAHNLAHFWPAAPKTEVSISVHSLLHRELSAGTSFRALRLTEAPDERPRNWSNALPLRLEAEQNLLAPLGASVAVPLQHGELLNGFFLLGPRSEGEYAPEHLRFAEEVAQQASRSLDSVRHAEQQQRAAEERIQDQAVRRMARATRAHLAPPDRFTLAEFDLAADYWAGELPANCFYDVVSLPGRASAVFLAEIAGPVDEANVRLVQLQALLRARACAYDEDLAELVQSTRRALAVSSANRPPIALFCARYVSGTRVLHYLNAGMLPPLLIRRSADGAGIRRLTTGGPALCAHEEREARFEAGEVELEPGDLLVLPSPGLCAAAAPQGEAWGETALSRLLLEDLKLPSAQICRHALAAADEHARRNPQAAPRMLVVLRAANLPALGEAGVAGGGFEVSDQPAFTGTQESDAATPAAEEPGGALPTEDSADVPVEPAGGEEAALAAEATALASAATEEALPVAPEAELEAPGEGLATPTPEALPASEDTTEAAPAAEVMVEGSVADGAAEEASDAPAAREIEAAAPDAPGGAESSAAIAEPAPETSPAEEPPAQPEAGEASEAPAAAVAQEDEILDPAPDAVLDEVLDPMPEAKSDEPASDPDVIATPLPVSGAGPARP